ncbi:hypothetical protein [Streptomyces ipomoeae]|uniref:hypothetical protein n=1 Tax=Streptomyces ipomoeae TaxID=103232 RepID=UPI0029BDFA45|nr:hypothetical protein [Streptomyces ipomoeae]MDX2696027.1 hypothetical protein [Streptomyces ipomoeae]MDX2841440.1 hypothetical protein [Streptomyces ipomoeae]
MATRDLSRLAKTVKTRRLELYPSRLKAAEAAGISKDTWHKVEDGLPVQDKKYTQIDRALRWASGSCLLIAEGGEAVRAEYLESGGDVTMVAHLPDAGLDENDARRLISDVAVATMPGTPVGEVQAFNDQIIEALKERGVIRDRE